MSGLLSVIPHALVELTLFDVEQAVVLRSELAQRQWVVAPRTERKGDGAWGLLTQEEKVRALHRAVERAVGEALPRLLPPG